MFGLGNDFQFVIFVKSIGIGVLLGAIFFVFRCLRSLGRRKTVEVFIQDLLFAVVSAFLTFIFILNENFGVIRFYLLAGEGIGFLFLFLLPFGSLLNKLNQFSEKRSSERAGKKKEKKKDLFHTVKIMKTSKKTIAKSKRKGV